MLGHEERVSAEKVIEYKASSNENQKVAELLIREFSELAIDPILDVGCGLGDIAALAWPDRDVTLIDVLHFEKRRDADSHRRIQADFFDTGWSQGKCFGTVLFSHVLQYIDESSSVLGERLTQLDPKSIITVTDVYDDQFSQIVKWAELNLQSINPEHGSYSFANFILIKEHEFQGELRTNGFSELSTLFAEVVLDRRLSASETTAFAEFLEANLTQPSIQLLQSVRGYQKT